MDAVVAVAFSLVDFPNDNGIRICRVSDAFRETLDARVLAFLLDVLGAGDAFD